MWNNSRLGKVCLGHWDLLYIYLLPASLADKSSMWGRLYMSLLVQLLIVPRQAWKCAAGLAHFQAWSPNVLCLPCHPFSRAAACPLAACWGRPLPPPTPHTHEKPPCHCDCPELGLVWRLQVDWLYSWKSTRRFLHKNICGARALHRFIQNIFVTLIYLFVLKRK